MSLLRTPLPVSALSHASMPEAPKPVAVHYRGFWFFGGLLTDEIEQVSCLACLEHLQQEQTVTCHHQTSRNTLVEPGEYCTSLALPASEYCADHAADHGDYAALFQWEEAI